MSAPVSTLTVSAIPLWVPAPVWVAVTAGVTVLHCRHGTICIPPITARLP